MDYKISVIIPVYNAESTLKTSINSVINQSIGFDNIELIIVNDNSIDNNNTLQYDNGIKLSSNTNISSSIISNPKSLI